MVAEHDQDRVVVLPSAYERREKTQQVFVGVAQVVGVRMRDVGHETEDELRGIRIGFVETRHVLQRVVHHRGGLGTNAGTVPRSVSFYGHPERADVVVRRRVLESQEPQVERADGNVVLSVHGEVAALLVFFHDPRPVIDFSTIAPPPAPLGKVRDKPPSKQRGQRRRGRISDN